MSASAMEVWREAARTHATTQEQVAARYKLAQESAAKLASVSKNVHLMGWGFGPDRREGRSVANNGSDEVVAMAILLRLAAQLMSAATDLFSDGRTYAAAALLRQLVEIEYLVWAFDNNEEAGRKWLASNQSERMEFFSPSKIRKAAAGYFGAKDYGYHCEMGGHPVPGSATLLEADPTTAQLLVSDMLVHSKRVWMHAISWSLRQPTAVLLSEADEAMRTAYLRWEATDWFSQNPPPTN